MEAGKNPILKQLREIVGADVGIPKATKTKTKKEEEMLCKM